MQVDQYYSSRHVDHGLYSFWQYKVYAGRWEISNDSGVARHVHVTVLRSHAEAYSLCA